MAYAVAGLLLLVLAIYHYPWAVLGALGWVTVLAFLAAIGAAVWLVQRQIDACLRRRRGPAPVGVAIGTVKRSREPVALGLDELQQGVLLGGSPGAGKTTLLVALSLGLPPGVGLAYVDLK